MSARGAGPARRRGAFVAPTTATAQTVDEIVARHVAARGGREALAAVRTVRMTGRATAGPGREAIVRREIARPGRIRTEFVFQGTTGVYAWDGSAGWRVSPLDGRLEPEPLSARSRRPGRRAGRHRRPARRLEGEGPRGRARRDRSAARRPRAPAQGHAEDRAPCAWSGSTPRQALSCGPHPRVGYAGTTWPSRRSSATIARRAASSSPARSRRGCPAGRVGSASWSRAVEVNPALDDARFQMPR